MARDCETVSDDSKAAAATRLSARSLALSGGGGDDGEGDGLDDLDEDVDACDADAAGGGVGNGAASAAGTGILQRSKCSRVYACSWFTSMLCFSLRLRWRLPTVTTAELACYDRSRGQLRRRGGACCRMPCRGD